jgi:hypothetical protein
MTAEAMDIDPPVTKPANAMAALMAGAKGKAKADASATETAEKERKEKEIREGLPW